MACSKSSDAPFSMSAKLGSSMLLRSFLTVELPNPLGPGGPGFYGARYAPFTINNDPAQPDFKVQDLDVPASVSADRFARRQQLLAQTEKLSGRLSAETGPAQKLTAFYEKAMALVTSPQARV